MWTFDNPLGRIPTHNDDVVIPYEWCIILDIPEDETPVYNKLEINGRLILPAGKNIRLRANWIHVREGRLESGT